MGLTSLLPGTDERISLPSEDGWVGRMTSDTPPGLMPDRDVANLVEGPSAEVSQAGRSPRWFGRSWWPILVCIAVYGALAMLDFGSLSSFGPSRMAELRSADQISQVWWIEWAYQALIHGHNPLFTSWQNDPVGINAGVNGSMLVLGALVSPITSLFGPVVSWNLLERAAPFVSALAMCLVLRRWTSWWPAAFVGGLLYGFSSYVLTQGGHLFLAFVPLPPLFFLLLHEVLVRQRWNPVRAGALLGLVCVAQFFIFSEVFASMVLMGVGATALYLLANRRHLSVDTHYLKTYCISAAVVGGALLVYPIFFTLFGPQHINGVPNPPADLAELHGDLLALALPGYLDRLAVSGAALVLLARLGHDVLGDSPSRGYRSHRLSLAPARHRPAGGRYDSRLADPLVGLDALCRWT